MRSAENFIPVSNHFDIKPFISLYYLSKTHSIQRITKLLQVFLSDVSIDRKEKHYEPLQHRPDSENFHPDLYRNIPAAAAFYGRKEARRPSLRC